MTNYNRGDIVLVPFPFSNQAATKKRPAVIVSSDVYNYVSLDIVIMAITGKTAKSLSIGECLILAGCRFVKAIGDQTGYINY